MKQLFKKSLSFLLITLLIVTNLAITTHAEYEQDKYTPSGIPYSQIEAKVKDYMAENEDTTAGVSIEIFDQQNTLYRVDSGYMNMDKKTPVTKNTVFEWGSCSKLLVWTSVMQLYEQRLIDLNEDIKTYLPNNFLKKTKFKKPITMMDLMNHTAGFEELTYDWESADINRVVNLESALKQCEPAQVFEPGAVCSYSNYGCSLAAYIVERIIKMPFYEYVHKYIFTPLGMKHTAYNSDLTDNTWVKNEREKLSCYYIDKENYIDFGKQLIFNFLYPAGMATGTMDDFVKFAKALIPNTKGASPLFHHKETLELMLNPTLFYGDSNIPRVCHGLWTMQFKVNAIGHAGNTYCSSFFLFDPSSGLGVTILTNQTDEYIYNFGIPKLLFGEYEGTKETIQNEDLSGIYIYNRRTHKGFFSIFGMINFFPIKASNKNPGCYNGITGTEVLTPMGGNTYRLNLAGSEYFVNKQIDKDGNITLQMMSMDLVKCSPEIYVKLIISLLTLISIIICFINLFISFIIYIVKRIRHKTIHYHFINKCKTLTQLSVVCFALIFYRIIISDIITIANMWYRCVAIGLLALIPIGYAFVFLLKKNTIHTRRSKVGHIVTLICGLLVTINIVLWQMFIF